MREAPVSSPPQIQRLERLAWLMDAEFRVPFTTIRFGLDPPAEPGARPGQPGHLPGIQLFGLGNAAPRGK